MFTATAFLLLTLDLRRALSTSQARGVEGGVLTVDEVAAELRVTRGAVYALVRSGLLPAVHVGRRIRIAEKVLANFIEAGGRGWPGGWRKHPPSPEAA